MSNDQELRLECLRICVSVAEAKNAYFWINGEGKGQQIGGQSALAQQRVLSGAASGLSRGALKDSP